MSILNRCPRPLHRPTQTEADDVRRIVFQVKLAIQALIGAKAVFQAVATDIARQHGITLNDQVELDLDAMVFRSVEAPPRVPPAAKAPA